MAGNAEIDQSRIDETLSAYRELQSQFERVRDRLHLAEENRHTVNRRIYEKVRGEYDRELDAIRARMSPLRAQLETLRAGLEERVRDSRTRLAAVEEEQAEAAFRHAVGEYTATVIDEKQHELDARLAGTRASLERFEQCLASLDAVQNTYAAQAAPEEFADEPAPAPVAEAPRRPVLKAADLAATPAAAATRAAPAAVASGDRFENPHDWIDEVGRDPRKDPRPAPARDQTSETTAASVATATPARPNAPSLVFVSGTHTGQSIPLLPTTLTIGREHDNNIEIKDAEVARYHARILHERGSYVVEDLESTTGTWVNGKRARRAVLNHGDVIKVGQTELAIDFEWATHAG
jgi:Inner membrane component of T3SS, cytoplasmic domain